MKLDVIGFIAIANVLMLAPSLAQPSQKVNGCGPAGILGHAVPDEIRILNCKLKVACNSHDTCYAKCLPGGALFNNPSCQDGQARYKRRLQCDADFVKMMNSANQNRRECRVVVKTYEGIVRMFGNMWFYGIGIPGVPEHIKEELYRAPLESFQGRYLPVDEIMKRNYEAVDAFDRYAESAPTKFSQAEIDAAFESIAANYPLPRHVFEFRSSQSGAELIVKPVTAEWMKEDPQEAKVIWKGGR